MKWRYRVPGRVELVGKHVDYAGGTSVTCATDVAMTAQVVACGQRVLRVHDLRSRKVTEAPLRATAAPARDVRSLYMAAAARRVARDFPMARTGAALTLRSSIPSSAGLSSSSALVVTCVMALFDVNNLWETPAWQGVAGDELAFPQYCAAVESGASWGPFAGDHGVGTRGGAQDHIAICASVEGMIGEYGYLPGRVVQRVAWPADWRVVVLHSGVKATKTGNALGAYNRVADSARALVRTWNTATGRSDDTLAAALASGDDALERLSALAEHAAFAECPTEYLRGRLTQFANETTHVVPGFAAAVQASDVVRAGNWLAQSQQVAESFLGNQVPETRWLAARAMDLGAAGATAFGAGFGGAVWALVTGDASEFAKAWTVAYRRTFPALRHHAPMVMTPSAGATRERA